MPEENKELEEQNEDNKSLKYEDLATENPEREEPEDEEPKYTGGSYSEEVDSASSVSDFKTLMNILVKPFKNKRIEEVVGPARVSRIFPDIFLDKYAITVAMLVMEQPLNKHFDFLSILNHVQDGLSLGYEGRFISDLLEAFGAVKDADVANLSKDLFS